jgi:hypothetical protein
VRVFVSFFALQGARALDGLQSAFQMNDALANAPPVHFELGLTGAAGADAAAEPRQMGPLAG